MSALLKDHDELELLDKHALAELLKVPVSWIEQQTRNRVDNPIPHVKMGKYVRFQEHAVREWLNSCKKNYPKFRR